MVSLRRCRLGHMLVLFEVVQCSRNATAQLSKIIYSLVVIDDIDAAIERERKPKERERKNRKREREREYAG